MRAVDIIQKKKQGLKHTKEEIYELVNSYVKGDIPDYQMSAWLMAVCFKGLDVEETAYLTQCFVESGDTLDFSEISKDVADKHSTGGVGDKVTIALIPLLASCGLVCAKLSGRGLGFTGGTIDKLEAIEGFNCALTTENFFNQIKNIGCVISSQTPNLTPADGKIYALRDVTSTVDNKSLICASVVSKKIASGANHIVLDVKYGAGAFVKSPEEALDLAELMIGIGKQLNRNIKAVISSMEQPLGKNIGNALEVLECIELLKGNYSEDLYEITTKIASMLLISAKIAKDEKEAQEILDEKIKSGKALEKFREIVKWQGGNTDIIDDYTILKINENKIEIKSKKSGFVKKLNALNIAKACKIIGGGRETKKDSIDFSVGVSLNKKIGDSIKAGETLAVLYATKNIEEAKALIESAFEICNGKPQTAPLIYKVL